MATQPKTDSEKMLETLLDPVKPVIKRGGIFDEFPEPRRLRTCWDRVEGMLLGVAIGDSLGAPTETMLPAQRREFAKGDVRDFAETVKSADGETDILQSVGLPTDDTQLTFWSLESLIESRGFSGPNFAGHLAKQTRGGGSTTAAFIRNFKGLSDAEIAGGEWMRCGAEGRSSNGALMRISPIVLPHLKNATPALWAEAASSSAITHRSGMSVAACIAFTKILWGLLNAEAPPRPGWFVDTFCEVAGQLEITAQLPRAGQWAEERFMLHDFVRKHVSEALQSPATSEVACNKWFSGAFLLETVPSVLFILERHCMDPETAIIRAANDTKDNDTIASIVGACVGALHGASRLPERWKSNLLGRTWLDDDGRVQQLISQAKAAFWDGQ